MSQIHWMFFPKSRMAPELALNIIEAFREVHNRIDSDIYELQSNQVLREITDSLEHLGFQVETGKSRDQKIKIPVLFGLNGKLEKYFDADAFHSEAGFVIEVEAGRAVVNYQFLKDLFQACMMHDVRYLGIAVRNVYRNRNDFEIVVRFFDTLFASNRLQLPLDGVLIIGY